ncbi:MAG TPA: hypothetical protein PK514_00665 [Spirochaetota bacterium]|nr:hypothetical protein [Spirochaetota bacterium]
MKVKLFSLILLLSLPVYSAERDTFENRQKKFISELFLSKDYFNTIAEARRLQYYTQDPQIEYFIYTCYYLAAQYNTVIREYKPGESSGIDLPAPELLVSQSYLAMGDYSSAYSSLGMPMYEGLDKKNSFTLFMRRVEPLLLSGDFDPLDSELPAASGVIGDYRDFKMLKQDLESFRENRGVHPVTGAVMSALIPGLGQLWSGRIIDALLSLASVALPASGGIYMKDHGRNGTAYTLFFFTGVFYAGNVYGGYNSVMLENRERCIENHTQIVKKYGEYDPAVYIKFGSVFN